MFYGSTSGGFESLQMHVLCKELLSAAFDLLSFMNTHLFPLYSKSEIIIMAYPNEIGTAYYTTDNKYIQWS